MPDAVELERLAVAVQTRIAQDAIDLPDMKVFATVLANEIIMSARFKIYAESKRRVVADRYPSDWWEAFKERWLPWLGVKYTECGVDGLIVYPTMKPVMKGGVPVFETWVKEDSDGDD